MADTIPSLAPPLVIFADDDEEYHHQIRFEERYFRNKFIQRLQDVDIRSVNTRDQLLKEVNLALRAERVPKQIFIILDLNFPDRKAGFEALNSLKLNRDPRIRRIPVYIYSISEDSDDISSSYKRYCNAYYHKTKHPATFWNILRSLDQCDPLKFPSYPHVNDSESFSISNDISIDCLLNTELESP